jgi:TonB-linked SusC/RagA family outer membrane protein
MAAGVGFITSVETIEAQVRYTVLTASTPATSAPLMTTQPKKPRVVTLTVKDSTVAYVVNALTKQAHVQLIYNSASPLMAKRVTVRVVKAKVMDALTTALRGTGLSARWAQDGETVIIYETVPAERARADSGKVTGVVTDSATGKPIEGARASLQGTKIAVTTGTSGQFALAGVPAGEQVVVVRAFGYKPVMRSVSVVGNGHQVLRVIMAGMPNVLSGVVTTATGIQRRMEVGNDITVLNADSIMRVAPVQTITDLLATRVPGLVVQHTSGVPGAPSRLRLRGSSSVLMSDDPILIVDGIRMYADQSGSRGPVASGGGTSIGRDLLGQGAFSGPSPLDQIDPNNIETVEVLKGPSATAIYGSDAANGVIVVTTKHGRVGPARWNLSLNQGRTTLPGDWPMNYFRFGHDATVLNSPSQLCNVITTPASNPAACVLDSIVAYQVLNDPRFSSFGTGWNHDATLTVSGGSGALAYSVTGSAGNRTGYLHLPDIVAQFFDSAQGLPAPEWMKNPQAYTTYSGSGTMTAQLGKSGASLAVTTMLFNSAQQQSSLQNSLGTKQYNYIGPTITAGAISAAVGDYTTLAQIQTQTYTIGTSLTNWSPWRWLPIHATAGLSVQNTDGSTLLPRGYVNGGNSVGTYALQHNSNMSQTLDAGTVLVTDGLLRTDLGINVAKLSQRSFYASTTGLAPGVSVPTNFLYRDGGPSQGQFNSATYGWYVQPRISLNDRVFMNPGFRLDGGSASGSNGQLNVFPRMDLSYIAVQRSASDPLFGMITLFRPRIAFGIAGVQPGPTEKLRLLQSNSVLPMDGTVKPINVLGLTTLGNTELHPERSRELEGGAELELWSGRLSLSLTAYHKMRYDAIMSVPLPPSVSPFTDGNSASYYVNVGTIRNTGEEATLNAVVVDTRILRWSVSGNLTQNENTMINSQYSKTAIVDEVSGSLEGYQARIVPGYPLNGLWARPITGYADENGDGVIQPSEVRVGDSTVYVGFPEPNYQLQLSTGLSLFNSRLAINTSMVYQNGLTQFAGAPGMCGAGVDCLQNALNNPATTLAQQAAIAASPTSAIGLAQTVNTLRWQDLSISYYVPPTISKKLRVPQLTIALQGSNLGLHTNYRGKDPDVNAFTSGNFTADTGQLPAPRLFSLQVRLGN